MDSRLIAGAYSQHYRALEKEEKEHDDISDSIARAKRLSQETNKRRKVQAQKRKLEAKREEQRRQEILTKRREEQKQATEKYQRSHVPPGQRQNSGRLSPQRHGAPCLEDALQLIRRSPRRERPASGRERVYSPKHENDDPLKRSYFNKPRHHSARPSSGRSSHHLNNEARAELMDYSLKNLTSSKSLFEQQLEQQQNIIFQQQQQSLREFSNAVQKELETTPNVETVDGKEDADNSESLSGSFSSMDSLERSEGNITKPSQNNNDRERVSDFVTENSNVDIAPSSGQQSFYLNQDVSQNSHTQSEYKSTHLNQDMTPSALFQKNHTIGSEEDGNPSDVFNGVTKVELLDQHVSNNVQELKSSLKQMSGDSLEESVSSGSNISLIKLNENNGHSNMPIDLTEAARATCQDKHLKQNQFSFNNNQCVSSELSTDVKRVGNSQTKPHEATKSKAEECQSNGQSQSASRIEPVIESYNPRYASAIGLSIWPGQPQSSASANSSKHPVSNNNHSTTTTNSTAGNISPYGKRTSSVILPPNSTAHTFQDKNSTGVDQTPMTQIFQPGGPNKNDISTVQIQGMSIPSAFPMSQTGINTKPFVSEADSGMLHSFKKQDFVYPLSQTPAENANIPQSHTLLPMHSNTYDTLQQEIKQLSDKMLENNNVMAAPYSSSPGQIPPNTIHLSSTTHSAATVSPSVPTQQLDSRVQVIHHIPHGNDLLTGPVPVPAVRTIFPINKPPVPKMASAAHSQVNNQQPETRDDPSKPLKRNESLQNVNGAVEDDTDNAKVLKGILKQLPPKVPIQGNQKGAVQARDSIELAKMQSEKRVKKKSVRWATFLEETDDDFHARDQSNSHTHTVTSLTKQAASRPTSAKAVSQSSLTSKPVRAASAGHIRQPMSLIQQTNLPQDASNLQNTPKSNLPPNFTHPLNTSAPINRPKAAAHIIMSSESHKDGSNSPTSPTASSLHKSQLEVKVKAVNNNFMSKVPVKVNTTAEVYHVSNHDNISIGQIDHSQQKDMQMQQNAERSRIRDNTASKRVPMSNSTVTRTSIVPASTKINYPIQNGVSPSYSTTTGSNNTPSQGPSSSTFDESKIRIDKTPTDEEISWLWDKVRNCLDKEGENKQSTTTTVGNDQSARQTPVLSTKIIDGNSLGFNSTTGATALRPGSGYFYTRNGGGANSNGQNKIKPAVQQQGSYLRRYGLLQQRRATSATGTPSNALAMQARAGSAGLSRYPVTQNGQQQMQSQPQQQQQQQTQMVEGPKPIAFSYKPIENVSESTAAFIMAERLAKQSLTDSHIAVAMDDAHNKQEVYNKTRGPPKGAGPSALSMEEQRLMESLDRLNERLNAPEQKSYSGTVHYHQPYQPHLPGFRGHQGYIGQRHHPPASPRGQTRSQSARIRQQIRQYR